MITDELKREARGFGRYVYTAPQADCLTAIADRIDEEHEAKVSYWQGASYKDGYDEGFASADDWLGQHEDAMAEHGWVRLPKDADGETIHLGDELEWLEGNRLTVNGIGEGGTLFYVDAQGDVQWTASGDKRHVKPDSWERIISEFAERVLRSGHQWGLDAPAATAEFVERCKKLAGEDA